MSENPSSSGQAPEQPDREKPRRRGRPGKAVIVTQSSSEEKVRQAAALPRLNTPRLKKVDSTSPAGAEAEPRKMVRPQPEGGQRPVAVISPKLRRRSTGSAPADSPRPQPAQWLAGEGSADAVLANPVRLKRLHELSRALLRSQVKGGSNDPDSSPENLAFELNLQLQALQMWPVTSLPVRLQETHGSELRNVRIQLGNGGGDDILLDQSLLDLGAEVARELISISSLLSLDSPEDRLKAGKEPRGLVTLDAQRRDGVVSIYIEDDGRGVELKSDSPWESILAALKAKDTKIDLNAQHQRVQESGGQLEAALPRGRGITWILRLPQATWLEECRLFTCGSKRIAIPARHIDLRNFVKVVDHRIDDGHRNTEFNGEILPYVPLCSLNQPPKSGVPLHTKGQRLLLGVNDQGQSGEWLFEATTGELANSPYDGIARDRHGEILHLRIENLHQFAEVDNSLVPELSIHAGIRWVVEDVRNRASSTGESPRIVILDSSLDAKDNYEEIFREMRGSYQLLVDPSAVTNTLRESQAEYLIIDWDSFLVSTTQVIEQISANPSLAHIPIIITARFEDDDSLATIMELEADAFLEKPFTREHLEETLQQTARTTV